MCASLSAVACDLTRGARRATIHLLPPEYMQTVYSQIRPTGKTVLTLNARKTRNPLKSKGFEMERLMGIEPTLKAWEASILPLNYSRDSKWANATKYSMASQRGQWGFFGLPFAEKEAASC